MCPVLGHFRSCYKVIIGHLYLVMLTILYHSYSFYYLLPKLNGPLFLKIILKIRGGLIVTPTQEHRINNFKNIILIQNCFIQFKEHRQKRLDRNIKSKSSNYTYLNIIKIRAALFKHICPISPFFA